MKNKQTLFIDTADINQIKKFKNFVDGVTTNPAIIAKSGIKISQIDKQIKKICSIRNWPVSAELPDSRIESGKLIEEAKRLYKLDKDKIVIKVPLLPDLEKYLKIIDALRKEKIPVNITALMTYEQMILAARSVKDFPQSYISLFWCRSIEDHEKYRLNKQWLNDHPKTGPESEVNSHPGLIVSALSDFLARTESRTQVIVGSIRTASQVGEAFSSGADIVTVSPEVIEAMGFSERTVETIADFDNAYMSMIK